MAHRRALSWLTSHTVAIAQRFEAGVCEQRWLAASWLALAQLGNILHHLTAEFKTKSSLTHNAVQVAMWVYLLKCDLHLAFNIQINGVYVFKRLMKVSD